MQDYDIVRHKKSGHSDSLFSLKMTFIFVNDAPDLLYIFSKFADQNLNIP